MEGLGLPVGCQNQVVKEVSSYSYTGNWDPLIVTMYGVKIARMRQQQRLEVVDTGRQVEVKPSVRVCN